MRSSCILVLQVVQEITDITSDTDTASLPSATASSSDDPRIDVQLVTSLRQLERGDHVVQIQLGLWKHHMIVKGKIGNKLLVIHTDMKLFGQSTRIDELDFDKNNRNVFCLKYHPCEDPDIVIERAMRLVGEGKKWNPINFDSEDFATFCKTGKKIKVHVDDVLGKKGIPVRARAVYTARELQRGDHIALYHVLLPEMWRQDMIVENVDAAKNKCAVISNGLCLEKRDDSGRLLRTKGFKVHQAEFNFDDVSVSSVFLFEYSRCDTADKVVERSRMMLAQNKSWNWLTFDGTDFAIQCKTGRTARVNLDSLIETESFLKRTGSKATANAVAGGAKSAIAEAGAIAAGKALARGTSRAIVKGVSRGTKQWLGFGVGLGLEGGIFLYSLYHDVKAKKQGHITKRELGKRIAKQTTTATATVVGGCAGGAIGQVVIPVPVLGAAVGVVVGTLVGHFVGRAAGAGISVALGEDKLGLEMSIAMSQLKDEMEEPAVDDGGL